MISVEQKFTLDSEAKERYDHLLKLVELYNK